MIVKWPHMIPKWPNDPKRFRTDPQMLPKMIPDDPQKWTPGDFQITPDDTKIAILNMIPRWSNNNFKNGVTLDLYAFQMKIELCFHLTIIFWILLFWEAIGTFVLPKRFMFLLSIKSPLKKTLTYWACHPQQANHGGTRWLRVPNITRTRSQDPSKRPPRPPQRHPRTHRQDSFQDPRQDP